MHCANSVHCVTKMRTIACASLRMSVVYPMTYSIYSLLKNTSVSVDYCARNPSRVRQRLPAALRGRVS